jgi:hypothetical protein
MLRAVEFRSGFANDWQFDADGNPVAPGARELADAIAGELEKHADVVVPVEQHSYYGWAFETRFAGCRFINVLNPGDKRCYFTVELCWCWVRALLLQRPRHRFDAYCAVLEKSLAAIPRVSDVVWESLRR